MKHPLRLLLYPILTLLPLTLALAANPGAKTYDAQAAHRKARLMAAQAAVAEAEYRFDDAQMLLDRAHSLDPANDEITLMRSALAINTELAEHYPGGTRAILSEYFQAFMRNPEDYTFGEILIENAIQEGLFNMADSASNTLIAAFPDRIDPLRLLVSSKFYRAHATGDSTDRQAFKAAIDRLIATEGYNAQNVTYIVTIADEEGDTTALKQAVHRLYDSAPTNTANVQSIARFYAKFGEPDSALVYLDRAVALDSLDGNIYLTRALIYEQMGDSTALNREVFNALKSPTLDFETKLRLLTSYVRTLYEDPTEQQRIEDLFEVLQTTDPGEPELHLLYGRYLGQCGYLSRAVEQFEYAIDLNSDNPETYRLLIQTLVSQDLRDQAANRAIQAIKKTSHPYFLLALGSIRLAQGEPLKAIGEMKHLADSLHPEFTEAQLASYYSILGGLYSNANMPDSAVAKYEIAIRYNPNDDMTLNNAAYIMTQIPDANLRLAEIYVTTALSSDPTNSTFLDTYAWVLYRMAEYPRAKEYIDKTLEALGVDSTPDTWRQQLDAKIPIAIEQCQAFYQSVADKIKEENSGEDSPEFTIDGLQEYLETEYEPDDIIKTEGMPLTFRMMCKIFDYMKLSPEEQPKAFDNLCSSQWEDFLLKISTEIPDHAGDIYYMCGLKDQARKFWKFALELDPDNSADIADKIKNGLLEPQP